MKLFGKELFNYRKEPDFMYDFARHGLVRDNSSFMRIEDLVVTTEADLTKSKAKKAKVEKEKPQKTPKQLYELKALNDNKFGINTEKSYIDDQIAQVDDKLSLLGKKKKLPKDNGQVYDPDGEPGGVSFSRQELQSIRERLLNRFRIKEFTKTLEEYPHTTSTLIKHVITDNKNLRCEKAAEFVPDMPKVAIEAMKKYNQMCLDLCNKKAVFYIIADKADFERKNERRDPILLAQSPFGFFWQVLGAWDEEMIYLGDL